MWTASQLDQNLARNAMRGRRAGPLDLVAPQPGALIQHALIEHSAASSTIIAGTPGQEIEILALFLFNVTADQDITLYQNTEKICGTLTGFPGQGTLGWAMQLDPAHFVLKPGFAFILGLGGPTAVSGYVRYRLTGS